MFSRSVLRVAFDVRRTPKHIHLASPPLPLPSAILLPQRSLHQTAAPSESQTISSSTPPAPLSAQSSTTPNPTSTTTTTPETPRAPTFDSPVKVTRSLLEKLPLLTAQGNHYITAHLHARPYLLTEGDHLRLPFRMPRVQAGDILRFNRASVIGSRDFTLKGTPYLDERLFECRVRVTGVDAEPLRIKEKTKRRQRHVRKVKSKHRHTLMRVMSVRVKTAEELLAEGAVIVDDATENAPNVEVRA